MTIPITFDRLREKLAACSEDVVGDDSYMAKRRLADLRRMDEWRRLDRTRGAGWIRDCAAGATRRVNGRSIDIHAIEPRLVACSSSEDYAAHRYFSALSAFPTRDRPGRRMKFFLVDDGHPGSPVMAIGTLSSAISVLKVRDAWIGWPTGRRNPLVWQRLAYVMDLSTCVGVEPYSALTSAKLLAHLTVSDLFLAMYRARYSDRPTGRLRQTVDSFALVVATGAFKTKTPTYRGIQIEDRQIFQMIGKTRGYSSAHVPDELYRELSKGLGNAAGSAVRRRGPHVRFSNLRNFARILGLEEESVMRPGQKRSVYVAEAAANARAFLRGEADTLVFDSPKASRIIDMWRDRWLATRAGKSHVLQSLRQPISGYDLAQR